MDFVDNHWCALWFGMHHFDTCTRSYIKREDKEGSLYIYLYLADTNCSSVHGIYLGEDTYTIDLRKALPSYFLRPASQHGWVVCGRDGERSKDYAENVLCVVEVKVGDAEGWLGTGELLTGENFFPDYSIDDGYKVLLTRQNRSGVYKGSSKWILPVDTVKNYYLDKTFFSGQISGCKILPQREYSANGEKIETITSLYKLLLEKGWNEATCFDAKWDMNNPCVGQSPATALLVQEIFGGEIFRYTWKKRVHYFNRINGNSFDLTSQERGCHPFDNYDGCTEKGISKKSRDVLEKKKDILMKNAGISMSKNES